MRQGPTGPATAAAVKGLAGAWVKAFNDRIHARLGKKPQVVIVDFNRLLTQWVTTPAAFGLTNVTTPACPATGVGTDGLPEYNFQTCTAEALSAAPPAGVTDPNWWKTYAFADGFHPTPYGYQLLGQLVARSLATAGWL